MNPSTSFYFICAISWQRDMLPNHYLHQENPWLEYRFNLPKGSIDGSGSLAPIDIRHLGRFDVLGNASHVEHMRQSGYNNVIFTTHVPGNGEHTNYQKGDDWGMVPMALLYPHYGVSCHKLLTARAVPSRPESFKPAGNTRPW